MLSYLWLIVFDGTLSAKVNTISLLRAGCRHTRYGEFDFRRKHEQINNQKQ